MAVKIKPLTSELIEMAAEDCGVRIEDVRAIFHSVWDDVGMAFNHGLGYSVELDNFGCFYLNLKNVKSFIRRKEKSIGKTLKYLSHSTMINPNGVVYSEAIFKTQSNALANHLTDIILIIYSAQLYEKDVRATYPKKWKSDTESMQAAMERMEKLFNVPFAELQVTVKYPIQKVYVQKLQRLGMLPNPVVYKDKKV